MRITQASEVFEHQLGHLVSNVIRNVFACHQDIGDRHRRHRFGLSVIGIGGYLCRLIRGIADFRNHVSRDGDVVQWHG
ncbi:hypothetical protein D3C86_1328150 [compost metagenome]